MGCGESKPALSLDDFQMGNEDEPKVDKASISAVWERKYPDFKLTAEELNGLVPSETITADNEDKFGAFKDKFLTLADQKKKEEEQKKHKKKRLDEMAKNPMPYLTQYFEGLGEASKKMMGGNVQFDKKGAEDASKVMVDWFHSKGKALLAKSFEYHDLDANGVLDPEEADIFFSHLMEKQSQHIDKMGANMVPFVVNMVWAAKQASVEQAVAKQIEEGGIQMSKEELKQTVKETIEEMGVEKQIKEAVEAEYRPKVEALMQKVKAINEQYKQQREERNKKVFALLDVNKDGTLQVDEVLKAMEPSGKMPGKEDKPSLNKQMMNIFGISDDLVKETLFGQNAAT